MACTHRNVQQYTECCLDCGANIYETEAERRVRLLKEIDALSSQVNKSENDRLEDTRDELLRRLRVEPDPQDGGQSGGW